MSSSPALVSLGQPVVVEADPVPAAQPVVPVNLPVDLPTMLRELEDAYIRAALTRDAVQQEGSSQAARDGADDAGREAPPPESGRALRLTRRTSRPLAHAIRPLDRGTTAGGGPGRVGGVFGRKSETLSGWGRAPVVPGHEVRSEELARIAAAGRCRAGLGRSYGDSSLPAPRDLRGRVRRSSRIASSSFDAGQRRPARGGRSVAGRHLSSVPAARLVRPGHARHQVRDAGRHGRRRRSRQEPPQGRLLRRARHRAQAARRGRSRRHLQPDDRTRSVPRDDRRHGADRSHPRGRVQDGARAVAVDLAGERADAEHRGVRRRASRRPAPTGR